MPVIWKAIMPSFCTLSDRCWLVTSYHECTFWNRAQKSKPFSTYVVQSGVEKNPPVFEELQKWILNWNSCVKRQLLENIFGNTDWIFSSATFYVWDTVFKLHDKIKVGCLTAGTSLSVFLLLPPEKCMHREPKSKILYLTQWRLKIFKSTGVTDCTHMIKSHHYLLEVSVGGGGPPNAYFPFQAIWPTFECWLETSAWLLFHEI